MVHSLYDDKTIEVVMKENQDIVTHRNSIQQNVTVLKECLLLMNQFESDN